MNRTRTPNSGRIEKTINTFFFKLIFGFYKWRTNKFSLYYHNIFYKKNTLHF
jgi:hypothetical protein